MENYSDLLTISDRYQFDQMVSYRTFVYIRSNATMNGLGALRIIKQTIN